MHDGQVMTAAPYHGDARSGDLHLESLPTGPLPMKLDQIWSEFDFLAPQMQG